jgi:hypothetical protein
MKGRYPDKSKKNQNRIGAEKMGEPSFLAVITAGEYAYYRDDGVYVVLIGCLKN